MKLFDMIEAKRREERRKKLMEDGLKCFAGLATGLVIGGVAGVLFAPKSGEETREDIKNFYNEKKQLAEEIARNTKEKVEKVSKDLKLKALNKAEDMIDRSKEELEKIKEDTDEEVHEAKEKAKK